MAQVSYYGTGRRKSSVARVRLVPGEFEDFGADCSSAARLDRNER